MPEMTSLMVFPGAETRRSLAQGAPSSRSCLAAPAKTPERPVEP